MTTDETHLQGNRKIPGYTLLRRIGRGSMGAVLLARQNSLGRLVAVKVLAPRFARNANFVRRFFREAQAAARLNHPNVVSAIDVGEAGAYKYFVMEYVEGPTVAELLARGGPMAPDRAVGIVIQVARALDHALANGMVHRDVKPANIILTETGMPKLCDLGLAKEVEKEGSDTQQGETLGTPDYIAPEQARGDAAIDIRADIYSLGATLFHMVTGGVPFIGPTPAVVMALHLTEPAPDARTRNPAVPARLAVAIRRMMAKDPADRYQAPTEVIDALSKADEEDPGAAPLPRVRRRRPRF